MDDEASDDPRVVKTQQVVLASARQVLVGEGLAAVTHLNIANRSGVGRKTIYRHWPTVESLLYDTLASANFPQAERTGELRADLLAHLEALRRALVDGPLAYVIHALNERAAVDTAIAELRDTLTEQGCAPIREILRDAIKRRDLPRGLDVEEAAGALEGPLFYRTLVRHEPVPAKTIVRSVDRFLREHIKVPSPH
jgi:AcrR family transcriptional regulator